jgi:hypothetical protein
MIMNDVEKYRKRLLEKGYRLREKKGGRYHVKEPLGGIAKLSSFDELIAYERAHQNSTRACGCKLKNTPMFSEAEKHGGYPQDKLIGCI